MSESNSTESSSLPTIPPLDEIKKMNLHEKIDEVMKHVKYVQKNSTVSTGNDRSYKAVTHDDVTAKLHDFIAMYGITIVPEMIEVKIHEIVKEVQYQNKPVEKKLSYRADVWVEVEFTNAHNKDDSFKKKWFAYAMDSMDKATGKAVSMAVKFCYLKTFMLESGDDEESREFENRSNFNPDDNRHNRHQNRNGSNNQNRNNGNQANNKGSSNGSNNNANNNRNGNQNSGSKEGAQGEQKTSEASENQIKAIAKIAEQKGIQIDEKFKSTKTCSSQEAGEEIKRLSSIKK